MKNPELRFSIWDENETVLFDSYDYNEILAEVGPFEPAPLYKVGDKIRVGGKKRTIGRFHIGISEGVPRVQVVIVVEGIN